MLKNYIPFYKNNLKIALPIVLTQVGGGIVALMDNVMVGHLGAFHWKEREFTFPLFSSAACAEHASQLSSYAQQAGTLSLALKILRY